MSVFDEHADVSGVFRHVFHENLTAGRLRFVRDELQAVVVECVAVLDAQQLQLRMQREPDSDADANLLSSARLLELDVVERDAVVRQAQPFDWELRSVERSAFRVLSVADDDIFGGRLLSSFLRAR